MSTRTVRAHAHGGLPRNACTALISGIAVGVGAEAVRHDGTGFTVTLSGGEELTAEHLLVATGRRVDLAGLGVGAVGLDETARSIPTDERLRAAAGCGRSVTSRARARSPTWPPTRRRSPPPTSWARTAHPPTTTRCRA